MATQPNVVMILADDLGYGDLGCYGHPDLKTPHLDRLASEGVRFSQHYSGSPLCAPARASLLTGRYNHRTGALSVESNRGLDRISLRDQTMADCFKQAGYATGMVGKWHNGLHDLRYHPNQRGFDEFVGFLNGGMHYWSWLLERNGQPFQTDGRYLTDVFTDEAVGFLKRHQHEPFFLYLAYNAPHNPLEAPDEAIAPYRNSYNEGVATLYGMISQMDAGIGRVLDALQSLGLEENTLVLFTSDNGPWLGMDVVGDEKYSMARYNGPFRGMKQDVLEGGIRVPALLRWPDGLSWQDDVDTMIHFCDWLPTLLSACQVSCEGAWDGMDILPALQGVARHLPTQRFWQYNRYDPVPHCNGAMRDGPWKLYWPRISEAMAKLPEDNAPYRENFEKPHTLMSVANPKVVRELSDPSLPELYQLEDDPEEAHNLAQEKPERVTRMMRAYETWFETVVRDCYA